jgi:Kef-type K+ transport system membrane component KefB
LVAIVGLIAGGGLYVGKLTRRIRLPSLIGYMILGVVLGVSCLGILNEPRLEKLSFITELALGFVALTIGAELNLRELRRQSSGIVWIILFESFGAFVVVFAGIYLVTRDLPMALMFGAVAPASAPAGTVAVIQEYKAKGNLTKALYAVVGFDDALAIAIYALAAAVARGLLTGEAGAAASGWQGTVLDAGQEVGLSLVVGAGIGFFFNALIVRLRSPGEVLMLTFGAVLAGIGLSVQLHTSLILTNMTIGFILCNLRKGPEVSKVKRPVGLLMPLLFALFFALAGAHLNVTMLPSLGLIGVVYVLCRSGGLIGGASLGAAVGGAESKIRKYVGLGILSQAGVAIALALISKEQLASLKLEHATLIGASVITAVTATSIVFEIVGPILTKIALQRAGEITVQEDRPTAGGARPEAP